MKRHRWVTLSHKQVTCRVYFTLQICFMERCRANVNLSKLHKHSNDKNIIPVYFLTLPEAAYVSTAQDKVDGNINPLCLFHVARLRDNSKTLIARPPTAENSSLWVPLTINMSHIATCTLHSMNCQWIGLCVLMLKEMHVLCSQASTSLFREGKWVRMRKTAARVKQVSAVFVSKPKSQQDLTTMSNEI